MPLRNLTRTFVADSYYHVYNRGINKDKIFPETADYQFFINLLSRHLDVKPVSDKQGREYKWLKNDIEVVAFCLMPSHFHLLVYQLHEKGITSLMLSLCTAYTMYFNKKYHRRGPLFESTYKSSLILNDAYLIHISRYIHLNPREYKTWPYSSYKDFLSKKTSHVWLHPKRVLEQFSSQEEYKQFTNDYEDLKHTLDLIKVDLADT